MSNHENTLNAKTLRAEARPKSLGEEHIVRRSLWGDAVRRFRRNRLAMLGLLIITSLMFVAFFADVIAPYPYDKADFTVVRVLPFQNPAHPLGTDSVGRDYLTRLIYGARTSMFIGISVPFITFSVGITLGALLKSLRPCRR